MFTNNSFHSTALRFTAGIAALRTQATQINKIAEQHDRNNLREFARDLAFVLHSDQEELSRELLELFDTSDVEVEAYPDEMGIAKLNATREEFLTGVRELMDADPNLVRQLLFLMNSFVKQPPAQARFLRRNVLKRQ
jgi:hypothetical protein